MKLHVVRPLLCTLFVGTLLLSLAPLDLRAAEAAPTMGSEGASRPVAQATPETRSYTFTPTSPPQAVDGDVFDATFTVAPGDFPAGWAVDEVTIDIDFAKSTSFSFCEIPDEGFDHAEEIGFRLVAPDGTLVTLVEVGDYENNAYYIGQVTVTFDDDADTTVVGSTIESGTFLPSSGAMADFRGIDPAANGGLWTLQVEDSTWLRPTCLYSATLSIDTQPVDLSVAKTGDPNPVYAGQEVLYEITAHNGGQMVAQGVVLTDTLPAELTFVTDTGGCSFGSGTGPGGEDQLFCDLGDLAPDSDRSLQVLMRVPPDAVAAESDGMQSVTNAVTVGGTPDAYPENDTVTYGTVVRDLADLQVTKLSRPDITVQAGETFTYTLIVDNLGPSYARNVTLQDDILADDGFTLLGVADDPGRGADACSVVGTWVECEMNEPLEPQGIAPGSGRWTIEIAVQADEAQTVSNLASVLSADPDGPTGPATATQDPDTANNEDSGFVSVTAVADLALSKAAVGQVQVDGRPGGAYALQPDAVSAGGRLTYTLVVTNNGPSTAENVTIEDRLPAGIEAVVAQPSQGTCGTGVPGDPLHPLTCNLGTIASGGQAVISIAAQVPLDVADGLLLTNEAWVSSATFDPDNTDNFDMQETTVETWPDLSIVKTGDPSPVYAGQEVLYQITAHNGGQALAEGVRVTDTLPLSLTYVADTIGCTLGAGTGPEGEDQLFCDLGDLAPDSSRSFQVLTRVSPDAVAAESDGVRAMTNVASVGGAPDSDLEDNTTASDTLIRDLADLRMTKLSQPDTTVQAGETFTYTLMVDNLGPSTARNVTLQDDILASDGFTLLGVIDDPDRDDACGVIGGTVVECELTTPLEPQGNGPGNGRWTIEILVRADEAQTVSNLASVLSADPDGPSGPATGTQDPDVANNEDSGFVSVTAAADLALSKIAVGQVQLDGQPGGTFILQPNGVTAGGRLTYTLAITNDGPSTAENVAIEDRLPFGITEVRADPSQGQCTTGIPGDPLSPLICNLGTIASGGQAMISITAQLPSDVAGGLLLTNEAWVSSATFDPDNTDDFDTLETPVNAWSDLAMEKQGPGGSVLPGMGVTYVITASNLGPSDAPGARISDLLPPQLTGVMWVCEVTGGASCADSGSGDLDEVAVIPAGGTVVCSLEGTLGGGGEIVNTATVATEADLVDPFLDNNSASVMHGMEQLYVPLVVSDQTLEAPDLVVTDIVVTSNDVWVTVQNQGDAPVVDGFWVDAYVDPEYPPRAVNQVWSDLGDQGMIWGVGSSALPIDPDESLVLRVDGTYYAEELSQVSWPLSPGTPVYVQVDSFNPGTTYGLVLEDHEILGGSYNNVAGPAMLSMTVAVVPDWFNPAPKWSPTSNGDTQGLPPREP